MKKLSIYIVIGFITAFFGKDEKHALQADSIIPEITVETNNAELHELNGVYYFHGNLFSGYLVAYYSNGSLKEKSGYANGKLSGKSLTWFPNGNLETERYYKNGEKDSINTGWYENGQKRFEFHFKNGLYNGINKEWYESGAMLSQVTYNMGKEVKAKQWRENGKLFTNYVVKDGIIYGLNNSNLCYSIKDERGQYVPGK